MPSQYTNRAGQYHAVYAPIVSAADALIEAGEQDKAVILDKVRQLAEDPAILAFWSDERDGLPSNIHARLFRRQQEDAAAEAQRRRREEREQKEAARAAQPEPARLNQSPTTPTLESQIIDDSSEDAEIWWTDAELPGYSISDCLRMKVLQGGQGRKKGRILKPHKEWAKTRKDELTDGAFSDAQADAARYRGSVDKAGKDAYADAIQTQNDLFDKVKDQLPPDALNQAKSDWRQYSALQDVSDALQRSTSGTRPEVAAVSKAAQPVESVNPKQLAGKLNQLYNDGVLQTAFGDQAHALLDHTGAAQQQLININNRLTAQKSQQRAIAYVAKRAAVTGIGVPVAGEGLKLIGALSGKK